MHGNVTKKLEEADKSDGYFITVTTLNGNKLSHYQQHQGFLKEDLLPSLEEIKKLIMKGLD